MSSTARRAHGPASSTAHARASPAHAVAAAATRWDPCGWPAWQVSVVQIFRPLRMVTLAFCLIFAF